MTNLDFHARGTASPLRKERVHEDCLTVMGGCERSDGNGYGLLG